MRHRIPSGRASVAIAVIALLVVTAWLLRPTTAPPAPAASPHVPASVDTSPVPSAEPLAQSTRPDDPVIHAAPPARPARTLEPLGSLEPTTVRDPRCVVHGEVVDEDGRPLAGVDAYLTALAPWSDAADAPPLRVPAIDPDGPRVGFRATTDAAGRFRIEVPRRIRARTST